MPRLHYFPDVADDPYQAMISLAPRAEGWTVAASASLARLLEALRRLGAGDVLHVTSAAGLLAEAQSGAAARRAVARFRVAVQAALDRGVRLIWTVDGLAASAHPDVELEAARFLAAHAWRVLGQYPLTPQAVAAYVGLSADSYVTLRQASYKGIYASASSRAEARAALGIPSDAPVVGIRRGTADVAGVVTAAEPVPTDLGTWCTACDLLVVAGTSPLDQSVPVLAATFGRQCVLPSEPHLLDAYGSQSWVSWYEPGDSRSLADAILAAVPAADDHRDAALAFADEYTVLDMTGDYLRILTDGAVPAVAGAGKAS